MIFLFVFDKDLSGMYVDMGHERRRVYRNVYGHAQTCEYTYGETYA